jgi:serine/threonine-protein kinase RsbW
VPDETAYAVRRLQPQDASGVADCFRQIYGEGYIHPEIYHPDDIVRLNRSGALVSVVAVSPAGRIVGHYALERPDLGPIAEGGEAVVLPEHRHHRLTEDMHALLEREAQGLQLLGLYGQAVTNHLFTQKLHERFGFVPCAVNLGASPQSFHNMPEALPQRMSLLLGFKYLSSPGPATIHVPEQHRDICMRIYERLGVPVTIGSDTVPSPGRGNTRLNLSEHKQIAVLTIVDLAMDTAEAVASAAVELTEQKRVAALYVDVPLADAAAAHACAALEQHGFFFAGLAPRFTSTGDALRLQRLACDLDISLLQIADPLARELVDHVDRERRRAGNIQRPS